MGYRSPEPLAPEHELSAFGCGEPALDEWLKRHARASHSSGGARVFVTTLTDDPTVVGYYALAAAQAEAVPVVLLARLAGDSEHQHRHVGASLLRDAMLRVLQAADPIGIRALVVHAKHDRARDWYEQYGFEPSPTDPLHLVLLIKDTKRVLAVDARWSPRFPRT